ncbi:MAG: BMP family ABC transporter substrate-binding protein [Pseudomonadota bacterium]
MNFTKSLLGAAALALAAGTSFAEPGLIYDTGTKFDGSFNEAAYNGAEAWAAETGGSYAEIELAEAAQREQAIRRLADRGHNPVVMTGFSFADTLNSVAPEYPDTTFVIIDSVVDQPNVRSVVFREHEGSYLVGVLAGMATETGTVGFIGGMDIGLISRFGCGYAQGVVSVNEGASVLENMVGVDDSAWVDVVRGGEIARTQISRNADVIFAAAGLTGEGVLQTAAENEIFGIGVDSNQNHLQPGSVLTSMIKRVDLAVYDAFLAGDATETGVFSFGVAEDGVGWSLDEHNEALISEEMQAAVEAAREGILNGDIVVHNYTDDDTCPVEMQ